MDGRLPPATPNRTRNAYPSDLSRVGTQRVPLHRRGTSRQFEPFEDLLREAGYKETRIFTPENERREAAQAGARNKLKQQLEGSRTGREGKRNTGGGLVGFLAGFVPSWSDTNSSGPRKQQHLKTQSLGRATGKQAQLSLNDDDDDDDEGALEGQDDDDFAVSPLSPTPFRKNAPIITTSDFSSPGSSSSSSSRSPPLFQKKLAPLAQQGDFTPRGVRPRPDARSTLRHMISAPDFAQQRPGGARAADETRRATGVGQSGASSRSSTLKVPTQQQKRPPLPANWLNTVTNAVMGSSGTHVGRPRGRPRIQTALETHRRSHTVANTSGGSGPSRSGSLVRHGFAPRTPIVETTPGLVTPASVVCRSAPGSRSASLVRQPSRSGVKRTQKQKHQHSTSACLPCLGVTSVEVRNAGDADPDAFDHCTCDDRVFSSLSLAGRLSPHLAQQRQQSIGGDSEADALQDDSEADSDGELDFARLLVPARRQHSIHSLRRHLHNHSVAASTAPSPPSAYTHGHGQTLRASGRTRSRASLASRNQSQIHAQNQKREGRSGESGLSVGGGGGGPPPASAVSGAMLDPSRDPELHGMFPRSGTSGSGSGSLSVSKSRGGGSVQRWSGEDGEDEDELARWAERGLPGLQGAVNKKRGALPWSGWTHSGGR